MLLSSVIIIIREVLEAAVLFSILIALTRHSGCNPRWIIWSFVTGILGAYIYAMKIGIITEMFQGSGQELFNAGIQLGTYTLLVVYLVILLRFINHKPIPKTALMLLMLVVSSLAITHEGSEIILYFVSVTHSEYYLAAITGMIIGASIGISIGLLFYYFLINIHKRWSLYISFFLLLLMAAGMVSQASVYLIQADRLQAQLPIWDMSGWLAEESVLGQLLYATIGYEATPSPIQFCLYLCGLVLPLILLTVLQMIYIKERTAVAAMKSN